MNKETWDDIIKNGAYAQELEWFAVDNKGQLGVFTAIMNAPIPNNVKSSFEIYCDLKQYFEKAAKTTSGILTTKERGNFIDWIKYAEKGFFAFDFYDVHRVETQNQYDLIARPITPLTVERLHLPSTLESSLAKLDCDFGDGDLKTDKVK
jgi:hypothetical protein